MLEDTQSWDSTVKHYRSQSTRINNQNKKYKYIFKVIISTHLLSTLWLTCVKYYISQVGQKVVDFDSEYGQQVELISFWVAWMASFPSVTVDGIKIYFLKYAYYLEM